MTLVKPILRTFLLATALAAGCAGSSGPTLEPATARRILEEVRRPGAHAVLVNVWATWCAPCREEFPDLVRLQRTYEPRGLRVLFVSGDLADARAEALSFLREHGVPGRTFLKDGTDQEFIDTLHPEWSGALPATLVFDRDAELRDFWEGKATYAELETRIRPLLGDGQRARRETR